jgi:hypothetical protein
MFTTAQNPHTRRFARCGPIFVLLVASLVAFGGAAAKSSPQPAQAGDLDSRAGTSCLSRSDSSTSSVQVKPLSQIQTLSAGRTRTRSTFSYSWPIKPFDRQHPVRGFFDDPRGGEGNMWSFHFGIDIAAPDGTPVYAVEAGKVFFDFPHALAVVAPDGRTFGYWHIIPQVRSHQFVRRHQRLGYIADGWGHVHFAEHRNGQYVNPLRPGALSPYADHTAPTISEIGLAQSVRGSSLVASAYDTTAPRVPGPWANEPVTPALLRWRLMIGHQTVIRWRTAADFRSAMLPASRFASVYAPGTRQNHQGKPGLYCFSLASNLKPSTLRPGSYRVEVVATDTRGNRARATVRLTTSTR